MQNQLISGRVSYSAVMLLTRVHISEPRANFTILTSHYVHVAARLRQTLVEDDATFLQTISGYWILDILVTNVTSSRGGCIEVEIKRLSIACPLGNAQGDQLYVSAMECMYPQNFLYPQCFNYKSPTLKWGYEIKTTH